MGSSRTPRRGPWLPEEDYALMGLVRHQGPNNWVRISQHLRNRSPKQCRERYHQSLKSSLHHGPISPQEGELIEQLVEELGKRWAEIARRLGNRSDNAVKNWWNGSVNRRKRRASTRDDVRTEGGYATEPMLQHESDTRSLYAGPPILPPSNQSATHTSNGRSLHHCWLIDTPAVGRQSGGPCPAERLPSLHTPNVQTPAESLGASSNSSGTYQAVYDHTGRRESSVRLPWIFDQKSDDMKWQPSNQVPGQPVDHLRTPSVATAPSLYSDCSSYQSLSPMTPPALDAHESNECAAHIANDLHSSSTSSRPSEDAYAVSYQTTGHSLPPLATFMSDKQSSTVVSYDHEHTRSASASGKDRRMLMSSLIH